MASDIERASAYERIEEGKTANNDMLVSKTKDWSLSMKVFQIKNQ